MEKENVGIDYEYRCRCLEEEINRLKEENDIKLKCSEEQRLDIERKLNKEIEWLRKVISGILHI